MCIGGHSERELNKWPEQARKCKQQTINVQFTQLACGVNSAKVKMLASTDGRRDKHAYGTFAVHSLLKIAPTYANRVESATKKDLLLEQ